jgi:PIN domain nuclease of toxin-antitoxin system
MRCLLDTCTFLWLALEPDRLSAAAVGAINDPANELVLSDVSVWEISQKHQSGKLPLPLSPRVWVPSRRAFFQLRSLGISETAILLSGELPGFHRDPFDRLIAAQAMESGMTVVTPDAFFSALGASRWW